MRSYIIPSLQWSQYFAKDHTPEDGNPKQDVINVMLCAIYPAIVWKTSQGNKPQHQPTPQAPYEGSTAHNYCTD